MDLLQRFGGTFDLSRLAGRLAVSDRSTGSTVYLFDIGSTILYALNRQNGDDDKLPLRVSTFLLQNPISSVHPFKDFDCCLCQDGTLYEIPTNNIESGSEETEVFSRSNDDMTDADQDSGQPGPWDVISIEGNLRVFADKMCHHICPFREGLVSLARNDSSWCFNVHEARPGAARTLFQRQPSVILDLSCRTGKEDGARVLSCWQTCSRDEPNFVEPVLLESLFGRELSVQRGHLAFIATDAGEVLFTFWTSPESDWSRCGPLFCLHQPVIHGWIPRFTEDSNCQLHGIIFVGQLGKVVMFSSHQDESDIYTITEYHIPGPVVCCTALNATMIHSDGICLWKSVLQTGIGGGVGLELKTISLEITGITQAQVYNSLDVMLLTEEGHVLLKSGMENWKPVSVFPAQQHDVVNSSLEDLLNKIQASSEHLVTTCEAQEQQKRILRSLSTAAHVALNEKVRHSFRTQLSSHWSSDEPLSVTFNVTLSNTKNRPLTEDEWHIVINVGSSSRVHHTKTVPLLGGPITENGILVTTKFRFPESLLLCSGLPLTVSCGLKYVQKLPDGEVLSSTKRTSHDLDQLAFVVPLTEFHVDELTFLRQQEHVMKLARSQRQTEKTVADALVDMAESRRTRLGLPPTVLRQRIHPALAPVSNTVTMNLSSVRQCLECDPSVAEDDLLRKLLAHITQECGNVDLAGLAQPTFTATIFDWDVTISAVVDGSLAKIVISSSCPSLAIGVRRAVLRRLKLGVKGDLSKPSNAHLGQASFVVPKSILQKYRSLHLLLNEIESTGRVEMPEVDTKQMTHRLYWEARDSLSCRLPFL